jgi:hypothetical protein
MIEIARVSGARPVALFDMYAALEHYLRVLETTASRRVIRVKHWPEAVPDTAVRATGLTRSETPNTDGPGCS